MYQVKIKPEYGTLYWSASSPIVKFMNSIYFENTAGENWHFSRIHSVSPNEDGTVTYKEPDIMLFVKDPDVALIIELRFGG